MKVTLKRVDDAFLMESSNADGLTVRSDSSTDIGGHNQAMRPMQMVLAALGSCSSIDVILLLKKQRQNLEHIELDITAERVEDQVAKVFSAINVHYRLYGDLDEKKVERACRISMEQLCSVSKMLEKSVTITWTYELMTK